MTTLTHGLAALAARPVDATMRARAALHVLDWIGCAMAGAPSDAGRIMAKFATTQARGPCRTIGAGRRDQATSLLTNGSLGNLLEMDDIHREAIVHPGPVIVPAALATAEATRASGADLLDAVVRGAEVMVRVGRALGPAHYRIWHNTATTGPLGAAAAVGSLLRLDPDQTMHALGNAGTQAAGLWQCRHGQTMSKQLHTAHAAHAGWLAATLAQYGFTGAPAILEGEHGFFAAMCPDGDLSQVLAPAQDWMLTEVGFKPYPACRHVHAVIDAALELRERCRRLRADDIAAIEITTYAAALDIADCVHPTTPLEARFSLQHAAAVTLLDGTPWMAAFEPACFARADLARLRAATTIVVDPDWGRAAPIRFRSAVSVRLTNGAIHAAEMLDATGDPRRPMARGDIIGKAVRLCIAGGVDADRAQSIADAAMALPDMDDLADFTRLIPDPILELEHV